ncbi:hypothetical protein VTJ04DRAFT_6506 [Mycothermus thermophilus]|uniref:uncharacterized protein n=1 Tax=Humicola insolens TaxID=85995 RepID=UPI00374356A5
MPIRVIPSKFSRAWTRVSWSLALLWAVSGTVIKGLAVVGVVVLGRPLLRMDIIAAKVGPLFLCLFFFAPSEGVSALGGLVGILSCSHGWTGGSHSVSIIGLDARMLVAGPDPAAASSAIWHTAFCSLDDSTLARTATLASPGARSRDQQITLGSS